MTTTSNITPVETTAVNTDKCRDAPLLREWDHRETPVSIPVAFPVYPLYIAYPVREISRRYSDQLQYISSQANDEQQGEHCYVESYNDDWLVVNQVLEGTLVERNS